MFLLSLTLTSTSEGLRINTAASIPNLIKYTGPYLNENCLVVSVISKKYFLFYLLYDTLCFKNCNSYLCLNTFTVTNEELNYQSWIYVFGALGPKKNCPATANPYPEVKKLLAKNQFLGT